MKIEYVAFHVSQPAEMAAWYANHLGFTIVRKSDKSPFVQFLADGSGAVMIELYRQPHLRVPDYRDADALQLHVALVSANVDADRSRLLAAVATAVGEAPILPTETFWRCCVTLGDLPFSWLNEKHQWSERRWCSQAQLSVRLPLDTLE